MLNSSPFKFRVWMVVGLVWAVVPVLPVSAQDARRGFVERVYKDESGEHKYAVFVPRSYAPNRTPAILFLHGAGECGTDGMLQTAVGLGPYLRLHAETFPFLVVFPQCEDTRGRILTRWSSGSPDGERALRILDEVERTYGIDRKHVVLTGWSMGGYGAWSLGAADPKRWSAIVPVSGGGDPSQAKQFADVPVWAFHGAADKAVPVEESRKMIAAIREAGGHPLYTEIPNGDHDAYRVAYGSETVLRWLLNPRTQVDPNAPLKDSLLAGRQPAGSAQQLPFVPALYLPRAGYVRLGNEALQTLSDAVPAMVPRNALTGRLADISDSTSASGYTFSVQFSGISYSAEMVRAAVQAYAKDRLNVQIAVRNIQLTIGATYVSGSRKSATAGPIGISVAHAYPLWLSFDVTPYVERGRIRLRLLQTRFQIPPDNFAVSGPAGVSTQGLGMTQDRVASGLVSGLYGARGRIEQQVSSVVPGLLAQLEEKLKLTQLDQAVGEVWPLPVYQPRIALWAQEISTDQNGVSVVLGMTVAAADPRRAPKKPQWAPPYGPSVAHVAQSPRLEVGIAPNILHPLSAMLVAEKLTHINVLDTPVKSLGSFADSKWLSEAIPDLKRYGDNVEVSAELVLSKPITVEDAEGQHASVATVEKTSGSSGNGSADGPDGASKSSKLEFEVPELLIALSIKPDSAGKKWIPYAELGFSVDQKAAPRLIRPTYQTRAVVFDWDAVEDSKVTAHFAEGYEPQDKSIDTDKLKTAFLAGWKEWTQAGPESHVAIPDVNFGLTKLRIADVAWQSPTLTARFKKPGVKLTNSSGAPLIFETKGPYSTWSKPFSLEPDKSSYFDIAYPLLFRRQSPQGGYTMYTLPVGSHSELRVPKNGGPAQLFQARDEQPKPEGAASDKSGK